MSIGASIGSKVRQKYGKKFLYWAIMSIGKLSIGALYISIGTLSIMGHTCTFWSIKGKFIGTISAGTQYLIIRSFLLYWDTIYWGHYVYLLRKYALRRPQPERTKTSRPSKSGRQTNQKAAAWRYIYWDMLRSKDFISITVSILGHIAWTVMDRVTTRGLVNLYPAVKVVPSMTDLLCLLAIGVNPQLIWGVKGRQQQQTHFLSDRQLFSIP